MHALLRSRLGTGVPAIHTLCACVPLLCLVLRSRAVCVQGPDACALLHPAAGHTPRAAASPCSQGGLPGLQGV
jgi:hypothetical protein